MFFPLWHFSHLFHAVPFLYWDILSRCVMLSQSDVTYIHMSTGPWVGRVPTLCVSELHQVRRQTYSGKFLTSLAKYHWPDK
jgi:hypothetical protein